MAKTRTKVQLKTKAGKSLTQPVSVNLDLSNYYHSKQLNEMAMALFGNIYGYGNAGKFRNRFYSIDDNSIGIDTYSRELLIRWCRELTAQLPVIRAAITTLSDYAVGGGNSYIPEYKIEEKSERGKYIIDWLVTKYFPRCCTRGRQYDFQKCKRLALETYYTDGDLLKIYGQDKFGFPMVQYIPANRIRSQNDNNVITEGQYEGCIVSDGVVYEMTSGQPVGYTVQNSHNLVSNHVGDHSAEIIVPISQADLIADIDFFDKPRGLPKVGYSVLQAMSIQELDSYLMDKLKVESFVALVESTPTGEAPQELQDTLTKLIQTEGNAVGTVLQISPQDHALEVKQGPDIRYVKAGGGDIKTLSSNTPSDQMGNYMTRLEQQILATMGVPHQILFSLADAGGRITTAVANNFRNTVTRVQTLLDKDSKKEIAIAVAKGLKNGLIPGPSGEPLDFDPEENLLEAFEFTHPESFSLDRKYDNDIVLENLEAGVITYNDACKQISNKTAKEVFTQQADDQIAFYTEAKRVSETTGRDVEKVIAEMRKTPLKVTSTMQTPVKDDNAQ